MFEPEGIILRFHSAGQEETARMQPDRNGAACWPASAVPAREGHREALPAFEEQLSAQDWLDWASAVG